MECTREGSITAISGVKQKSPRTLLRLSIRLVITAKGVTSDPVPDVVGIATKRVFLLTSGESPSGHTYNSLQK